MPDKVVTRDFRRRVHRRSNNDHQPQPSEYEDPTTEKDECLERMNSTVLGTVIESKDQDRRQIRRATQEGKLIEKELLEFAKDHAGPERDRKFLNMKKFVITRNQFNAEDLAKEGPEYGDRLERTKQRFLHNQGIETADMLRDKIPSDVGESLDYRSVDNYLKERTEERKTRVGFNMMDLQIQDDDEDERKLLEQDELPAHRLRMTQKDLLLEDHDRAFLKHKEKINQLK